MRGPYERLKYDFSRIWECPTCRRKERTGFTVTFVHCRCRAKEEGSPLVPMRLIEDGVRRVLPPISRPRPDLPERPPQAEREPDRRSREEGRGGEGPPPRERYGKPKFDKRGRGGERPSQAPPLQAEVVVGVDLPAVTPPTEVVASPPESPVEPIEIHAAAGPISEAPSAINDSQSGIDEPHSPNPESRPATRSTTPPSDDPA